MRISFHEIIFTFLHKHIKHIIYHLPYLDLVKFICDNATQLNPIIKSATPIEFVHPSGK